MLEKLEEISSRTWGEEETLKKLKFKSSLASDDIHSNSSTQSPGQSQFGFSSSTNGSPSYDKITRPKSAAPQLTGGSSSPQGHSHGLGIFEPQTDQSSNSLFKDFDIMKVGTRRSASTGVIGHGPTASPSVMDSLGLIPAHDASTKKHTTFMDLIQEDFPKSPSPSSEIPQKISQPSGNFTKILDRASSPSHHSQPPGGYQSQSNDRQTMMNDAPHSHGDHVDRHHVASYQSMERMHLVSDDVCIRNRDISFHTNLCSKLMLFLQHQSLESKQQHSWSCT